MSQEEKPVRRNRLLALNADVEKLLRQATGTRNFALPGLITHWGDIVGKEDETHCLPIALQFARGEKKDGMLLLRCSSSYALELQHRQVEFLARINAYFGYRAVARIKIEQGNIHKDRKRQKKLPALSPHEQSLLEKDLAALPDSALKDTLFRFGKIIRSRSKSRQGS